MSSRLAPRPSQLFALALLSSCYVPTKKVVLRLELAAELAGLTKEVAVSPRIAEIKRDVGRGVLALSLKRETGKVTLRVPGACPLVVDTRVLTDDDIIARKLEPLFDVGPAERVVGLGQNFELHATPNCAEARGLKASFVVTGGAALDDVDLTVGGRTLSARTRSTLPSKYATHGVVPVSAREQQKLRSELTFRVELANGQHFEQRLGISAVARSSGLPNVGLQHPVLLNGQALTLFDKPPNSQAQLRSAGALWELLPDVPGRYLLRDAKGAKLSLQSGRYDQTPLDCGRSDCHAELAKSAQTSPMTQVLASDLGGCHSLSNPACASACHTTGEPGTADGGFTHVQSELGLPALPTEYDDLPVALRRLGGVGCMACHGPGKIPEPSARSAILRNDVCAVCHDAPPRYGHVAALESTRMGHADITTQARIDPECSRCHTSWGALGRSAPDVGGEGLGITCAVCHDVHPQRQPADHAGLLRDFPLPTTLPEPPASFHGPSRVCISCHSPSESTLRPEASAAAIVAGQAGLEPESGAPLSLSGPHSASAKGCLSCHDSGPDGLELGKSHGFRATDASCTRCHATAKSRDPTLAARARQLLSRLDPEHSAGDVNWPWHAKYRLLLPTPQQTRALRDVLLVLEDPAADVHHPAYAKALLDAAERLAPGAKP